MYTPAPPPPPPQPVAPPPQTYDEAVPEDTTTPSPSATIPSLFNMLDAAPPGSTVVQYASPNPTNELYPILRFPIVDVSVTDPTPSTAQFPSTPSMPVVRQAKAPKVSAPRVSGPGQDVGDVTKVIDTAATDFLKLFSAAAQPQQQPQFKKKAPPITRTNWVPWAAGAVGIVGAGVILALFLRD